MKGLFFAALLALPSAAQAAQCGPTPAVLPYLAGQYGETVQGRGIAANGHGVLFTANVETGTWTMLVITPAGQTCIYASGSDWDLVEIAPAPMGEEG